MKRSRKWLLSLLVGCMACALAGLVACAASAPSDETSLSASSREGDVTSRALVVYAGEDTQLFVDVDTQSPYVPTIPPDGLFDEKGEPMPIVSLRAGNVVEVSGNGIMLESYPGQYPGISSVRVVEEGSPEDVAPYQSVVDEFISAGAEDTSEVPTGTLEYRTDAAEVTVMLNPGSYTWVKGDASDASTIAVDAAFSDEKGVLNTGIPDARISEAVEATVSFSANPSTLNVRRTPLSTSVDATMSINLSNEYETVPLTGFAKGGAELRIEPGYLYVIEAHFERGDATYPFITAKAE